MHILAPQHHQSIIPFIDALPVSTFFVRSVLAGHVEGNVFVNNPDKPEAFYILHSYGMSLLFGDTGDKAFNEAIRVYLLNERGERARTEWVQVLDPRWNEMLASWWGDTLIAKVNRENTPPQVEIQARAVEHTRVNFKFNPAVYLDYKKNTLPCPSAICPVDEQMYLSFEGSVIPRFFWSSPGHFLREGKGFAVMDGNQPTSIAFAAYKHGDDLELGIETAAHARGKGYAKYACMALIDYCLENGLIPHWSCREENTHSFLLAQKLGFEPTLFFSFYEARV